MRTRLFACAPSVHRIFARMSSLAASPADATASNAAGFEKLAAKPGTVPLYFQNTYLFLNSNATVLDVRLVGEEEKDLETVVICDATIFHPQGGGQPSDTGQILQESIVFDVTKVVKGGLFEDNEIWHYGKFKEGETFKVGEKVEQRVNEEQRRTNARVHSAGHLLDQAMKLAGKGDMLGTKGFHFPSGSYVEFKGGVPAEERPALLESLQKHCDELVAQAIPTRVAYVEDEASLRDACLPGAELGALSRLDDGPVRCVLVAGEKGCPCGGTHVDNTSEIKKMVIRKISVKKKMTKISYAVEA
eukprot:Stramenopile-MAST_4_protein_3618